MSEQLTLGSLFDGSGGFPLGALMNGIEPLWASEIEPFPIRVTTKRLPFMKHYGDVSQIDGAKVPPVDIITFGSPCQDMSVAGKRAGLEGSRSNLFFEAVRIIKEMREATNGKKPRWCVWENVCGAFSSNGGADFKAVLDALRQIKDADADTPRPDKWANAGSIVADGYSISWRVLDAQFWGVPQRRRRIYLVADFRGQRAEQVLFECEGVCGYNPTSAIERQGAAAAAESGAGTASVFENHGQDTRYRGPLDINPAISATYTMYDGKQVTNKTNASNPQKGGPCHSLCAGNALRAYCVKERPVTLKMRDGCAGGGKGPLIQNDKSATLATQNDQTLFVPCAWNGEQTAPTLTANNAGGGQRMPDKDNFNAVITQKAFAVDQAGGKSGVGVTENKAPTLATTHDGAPAVAYGIDRATFNAGKNAQFKPSIETETQPTLTERGPGGVAQQMTNNEPHYIVRRLTPTECARLQGFPDWWTQNLDTPEPTDDDIAYWREVFETHRRVTGAYSKPKTDAQIAKWLKAPHSDSAEYKMWGNGVALPCVAFVLAAIAYCDEQDKMA